MSEIKCPKCSSNQITANQKGFSGGKALVGGILTGGVGLLAGTIGSKKIKITCLSCGHTFNPGEDLDSVELKKIKQSEITENGKNNIVAAILALFLGGLGIHKFYLGKKLQGFLYLSFSWTFIPCIISFFDAIILLTMDKNTFELKYKQNK
jgi:TM2 domain-containing membrane protein YozV